MTKKHFEMIARRLREHWDGREDVGHNEIALKVLISDLAYDFADTNPNFNRDRFLQAAMGEDA